MKTRSWLLPCKEYVKVIKIRTSCGSREFNENTQVLEAPKPEKKEGVEATLSTASAIARSGAAAITQTGGTTAAKLGEIAVKFGKNVAHVTNVGGRIAKSGVIAANVGRVALKGAAVGGVVVQIVAIPLNIAEIVMSGMSLYKGSETEAGRQLRENAKKFEKQMNDVMKICGIPKSVISD